MRVLEHCLCGQIQSRSALRKRSAGSIANGSNAVEGRSLVNEWVPGQVEARLMSPNRGRRFVVVAKDGREYYISGSGHILNVAIDHNRSYAKTLRGQAQQLRTYADWQKQRVEHWVPVALKPISAETHARSHGCE
ncbi:MAG: hypothetical protein ACYDDA_14570 [Acidiferrobacteraceae bacterium]